MFRLVLLALVGASSIAAIPSFATSSSLDEILKATKDNLVLFLMGDPQPWFSCVDNYTECFKLCNHTNSSMMTTSELDPMLGALEKAVGPESFPGRLIRKFVVYWKEGTNPCAKQQNQYVNRLQREALDELIVSMKNTPPQALIILGDLTNFGNAEQIEDFQRHWQNFSIPKLIGFGNHDAEINQGGCLFNLCPVSSMQMFLEYTQAAGLEVDVSVTKELINGSFAYATRPCSESGQSCVNLLQLNNALDFTADFSLEIPVLKTRFGTRFSISPPVSWLKKQLKRLHSTEEPIIIGVHQLIEGVHIPMMLTILEDWMKTLPDEASPKVLVLAAHYHWKHKIDVFCVAGRTVPFILVGSVPDNRFSVLHMNATSTQFFGLRAQDGLVKNNVRGKFSDFWTPCNDDGHKIDSFDFVYAS